MLTDDSDVQLFSYGTLRRADVQQMLFGRRLTGVADALPGFRTERIEIDDAQVLAISGASNHPIVVPSDDPDDVVDGEVFTLTAADLRAADAYEGASYGRTLRRLRSGAEAWVYGRP